MASQIYTVRARSRVLSLLFAGLCCACHAQSASGGMATAAGAVPAMTLRGGADIAAPPQEDAVAQAEAMMKEQLDYWNSLTKEQQDELLSKMTPEERANAEGESMRLLTRCMGNFWRNVPLGLAICTGSGG